MKKENSECLGESINLNQGNLYISIGGVTQEEIDKMNEIQERNPKVDWSDKQLTLLNMAKDYEKGSYKLH